MYLLSKLIFAIRTALNKVFEQHSIQAVVHTASFKSLEESVLKPLEYYNDNVSCIMSLMRAMQRTGVRHLVHLSSLAVYGQSGADLSEDLPFKFTLIRIPISNRNKWLRKLSGILPKLIMNGGLRSYVCPISPCSS